MADVFVSHVEEDSAIALQIADALEQAGYSTWTYERDSVPGLSYLVQTGAAVEKSAAVVLLVSRHSLGSRQVTVEVFRGHETGKPFVPVLIDVSDGEFAARQPEWHEAVGASTSLVVSHGRIRPWAPRVAHALLSLDVEPSGAPAEHRGPTTRAGAGAGSRGRLGIRSWRLLAVLVVAAALVAGATVAVVRMTGSTSESTPVATPHRDPSAETSGAPATADAAVTPLRTEMGDTRITHARLATTMCPPAGLGACKKSASGQYLLLTLEGVAGGALQMTMGFSQEEDTSYVLYDGRRYANLALGYLTNGLITMVYGGLPDSAAGDEVVLVWPHNPHLRIAVMEG